MNDIRTWDLFCRVIDNFGDIGVCWRLAADLGRRGHRVRLWVDDASALAWMAPHGHHGVDVLDWHACHAGINPGDIVVEAFGCNPPGGFVAAMASLAVAPVWINLEYLSAESYVERSHRLASPQRNGLTKWFFYPGFTPHTGGLLREPSLLADVAAFDRQTWLHSMGLNLAPAEKLVTIFCYDNPALPGLLERLPQAALLLTCPGAATRQLARLAMPVHLRIQELPYMAQTEFDKLLWSSDLNLVRGEDSFVRAQWAGQAFAWHIYPQDDYAHATKLDAFLDLWLTEAGAELAQATRQFWRAWNGIQNWGGALPSLDELAAHCTMWRTRLAAQVDLSCQLQSFADRLSRQSRLK